MPRIIDEAIIYSGEEFAAFNVVGRPFLSEQGNTVTRGFITAFECSDDRWELHLRDVDYLNKKTRQWERKRKTDIYESTDTFFEQVFSDKSRNHETHLKVGGYGISVFIGPKVENPWTSIEWTDVLGTESFNGGILGDATLPPL